MLLTSLRRIRLSLGLTDKTENNRRLTRWIASISNRIESFLNRELQLMERTEYFDTLTLQTTYYPKAYPITEIESIYSDSEGLYTSPSEENDWYTGRHADSVVLDSPVVEAKKGLRVIYTGGIAEHATRSTYTMASALTTGKYVLGLNTSAFGYVFTGGTTAIVEVLYGIFDAGESLQQYDDTELVTTSGAPIVLTTKTKESLAEVNPDIVEAVELEIRYMDDHRSDYENSSTIKNATHRTSFETEYDLLPQTRSLIQKYQNVVLS